MCWHKGGICPSTDLRCQLQQAQEELGEVNVTLELIRTRELEAISRWRGDDVERYLKQPDYGELLDWLNAERVQAQEERDAAIKRAEAAEALAERRLSVGLSVLSILQGIFERSGIGYVVREMAWLTPAEALRARSPQSGQEEAEPCG